MLTSNAQQPLLQVAMAAKVRSGAVRVQITSCFQLPVESDAVQSPHSSTCALLKTSPPLPQPHRNFFPFCMWGEGGGWSGREEKVEIVQEVWITDSSFPWTMYSAFPERRQRLQFGSWHRTVPEIHTIPGVAVNCWAAAAGSPLTWPADLWPGMFQGRCPSCSLGLQQGMPSPAPSCPAPVEHCSALPQCCLSTCLARPSHSKKG